MGKTAAHRVNLDLENVTVGQLIRGLSVSQAWAFGGTIVSVFLAGFGIGMWTKSLDIPDAVDRQTTNLMATHNADQAIATANRRQFQFLQTYLQYMIASGDSAKQNAKNQFVQTIRSLYQSQVIQLQKDPYIDKTVGGNPLKDGHVRLYYENNWVEWAIPKEVQSAAIAGTSDLPPPSTWSHR